MFIFICAKNNQNVTRFGNSFQTKLRECFSDFLDLTKFLGLILVETAEIWQDLLKVAGHNQNEYQDRRIKNIQSIS